MGVGKEDKVVDGRKLILQGAIRGGLVLAFMGMGLYFVAQEGDSKKFHCILGATIIAGSVSAFSVIYDYDGWSTKKKIFIHTLCMLVTVFPALMISGWYDLTSIKGYLIMIASFIVCGLVAVTVFYLLSKYVFKNIKEEN